VAEPAPIPEYITTAELCRRLSICRRTVANHNLYRYALRVGSQWRFDWGKVLQHYARRTTGAQR
jgi:hypothetical protein